VTGPRDYPPRICYNTEKEVLTMANGTAVPPLTERRTSREPISVSVIPVDEKRFESEIRRIDTVFSEERKNREKFETRIEKAVNDLRGDMNSRFDKMEKSVDARFEKIDARFEKIDARFEKIDVRFEKIDVRFEKMNDKMDSHFKWMMGFLVGAVLIPIALQYFTK
jgi:predicted transcriptional regulator